MIEENIQHTPQKASDKYINSAITYMEYSYMNGITASDVSGYLGIERTYFYRIFKESLGISPTEYLLNLRIEKAKEILKSDHESLSDIALALGYSNLFDFSRDFKKHTGVAPSKY
jgi:AraC-like DNA-binding protein